MPKQDPKSSRRPAASNTQTEWPDPVLEDMILRGIPVTRENYISQNWMPIPKPWTAEHEAELPPSLRRKRFRPVEF